MWQSGHKWARRHVSSNKRNRAGVDDLAGHIVALHAHLLDLAILQFPAGLHALLARQRGHILRNRHRRLRLALARILAPRHVDRYAHGQVDPAVHIGQRGRATLRPHHAPGARLAVRTALLQLRQRKILRGNLAILDGPAGAHAVALARQGIVPAQAIHDGHGLPRLQARRRAQRCASGKQQAAGGQGGKCQDALHGKPLVMGFPEGIFRG